MRAAAASKAKAAPVVTKEHAELDVLDTLDLDEASARATLREMLLGEGEQSVEDLSEQLRHLIEDRLVEGHGETLFDLGQEDNGDSLQFTKPQWEAALERLRAAASTLDADCRVLLTRNVGGNVEVGPLIEKDQSATGVVMIRQRPKSAEDVIETRIAVIGNGSCAHPVLGTH